jgi:hypothetical protein
MLRPYRLLLPALLAIIVPLPGQADIVTTSPGTVLVEVQPSAPPPGAGTSCGVVTTRPATAIQPRFATESCDTIELYVNGKLVWSNRPGAAGVAAKDSEAPRSLAASVLDATGVPTRVILHTALKEGAQAALGAAQATKKAEAHVKDPVVRSAILRGEEAMRRTADALDRKAEAGLRATREKAGEKAATEARKRDPARARDEASAAAQREAADAAAREGHAAALRRLRAEMTRIAAEIEALEKALPPRD